MGLLAALQFLTRLPIHLPRAVPSNRMLVWFPLAGAIIGLLAGAIAWLAAQALPLPVAGAVGIVAGLLITGAFHEDGLGDIADSFGGGWTPQKRLEILKDPRQGSYGVAAIVASVVLRMLLTGWAPDAEALLVSFVAVGALGRAAALLVLLIGRPATPTGLAAQLIRTLHRPLAWLGLLVGVAVAGAALSLGLPTDLLDAPGLVPDGAATLFALLLTVLVTVLAAVLVWRLAVAKIGGVVGDVLGAAEQVAEVGVWLVLVAVLT